MNDRHLSGSHFPTGTADDVGHPSFHSAFPEDLAPNLSAQQAHGHTAAYPAYGQDPYAQAAHAGQAAADYGHQTSYDQDPYGQAAAYGSGHYDTTSWDSTPAHGVPQFPHQPQTSAPESAEWDSGAYPAAQTSGGHTGDAWDTGGWETGGWGSGHGETGGWETTSWEAAPAGQRPAAEWDSGTPAGGIPAQQSPPGWDAGARDWDTASWDTASWETATGEHPTADWDSGAYPTAGSAAARTEQEQRDADYPDARYPEQQYAEQGYPEQGHAEQGHEQSEHEGSGYAEQDQLDQLGEGGADGAADEQFRPGLDFEPDAPEDDPDGLGPMVSTAGAQRRNRRRPRPRRSALLTVAAPSLCVLGVTAVAASAIIQPDDPAQSEDDLTLAAAPEPGEVKTVAANEQFNTQLEGLTAAADDYADRASRTQGRMDLEQKKAKEKKQAEEEAARLEAARPKFFVPVDQRGLSAVYGQAGVNWMSIHTGIDFPVRYGTPVRAATDGTIRTQWHVSYGNLMIITAPDGTETWYAHLSSTVFQSGYVQAGTVVAYSGNSGNSIGPHLHFEVRPGGGSAIDPAAWLRDKGLAPN